MPRYVDIEKNEEYINSLASLLENCHFKHKTTCLAPNCRDCLKRSLSPENSSHLLPAANVQPVVCCKDCKYYTDNINDPNLRKGFCNRVEMNYFDKKLPDDYCSYSIKQDGD